MKLLLLALLFHSTMAGARELVCNDGALVIRENPIPKEMRSYPDADLIATVYSKGVVTYLKNTFGYSGDGGYGRGAYQFHERSSTLNIYFYGYSESRSLEEQELGTSGKFSNAVLRKEGAGIHLMLMGGGRYAEWFFEDCAIYAPY